MRKIYSRLFIPIGFITFFIYGCTKGKGEIVSQVYTPSQFDKVELHTPGNVFLVSDSAYFLEVHSHQNIIDLLKIETHSQTLSIKLKPGQKLGNFDELSYYVHTPYIKAVTTTASGNINGDGSIAADEFNIKTTASGNVSISGINSLNIEAKSTASGNIELNGIAENTNYEVSASGGIKAFGLVANNTKAKTTASGNIETSTINNLDAKITASGNILYKGSPVIEVDDNGSGNLINSN